MAIIKKSTNDKSWKGCGEKGMFLHYWWECKFIQPLWKTLWRFLRKLGINPPYDPDAGKDWGQEEKGTTEDEVVGWHHWLNEHEFGWTPGVGDGQRGLACCSSWDCKESDMTERLNWSELTDDPAIPLLSTYPEEIKIEKDTCIPLFIAALIATAGTWKQPRCPSTDEWIKKLWYIYRMEYYWTITWNAFESVLMRWMNLEPIIQSEVSQKEKDKYHILMHIYVI